jgi:guanosine-3',5'-bis(diphosphate) 3'-pyrophosphohydrolase
MKDCLIRIKKQPKEVWAVKLADRITNLQSPPQDWSSEKRAEYLQEARLIYDELKEGNEYLAKRLEKLMDEYRRYL